MAKQAYEAIDGCLQGFEDTMLDKTPDGVTSGMSPSEAEMVKVGVPDAFGLIHMLCHVLQFQVDRNQHWEHAAAKAHDVCRGLLHMLSSH